MRGAEIAKRQRRLALQRDRCAARLAGSATYMGSVTFSCAADAQSLSITQGADIAVN